MYGDFEEPLFLAKEVASWIDYSESNVSKMLSNIDDYEKTTRTIITSGSNYQTQAWFLTEHGLYEVLMQSRKPIAKQFKKEIKTLLKNIRKRMFLPKYIEKANQYSIQDIVKEAICQVVPIIIQELEDKAEKTKQAEREFEKLEIKVKKRIE
ncbi:BRO family protein [Lachnospiraceae bacterium 46-61]